MAAYAGTYTIESDLVSHHVDISWIDAWTGTTQVRQFKIEGDTLRIRSMPAKDFLDGRVTFATLAPDELSANIKFAPDEQALKCAVAPDAFAALDNAWGRRGWTCARVAALSEAELEAALEMAWRHAGPKVKAAKRR